MIRIFDIMHTAMNKKSKLKHKILSSIIIFLIASVGAVVAIGYLNKPTETTPTNNEQPAIVTQPTTEVPAEPMVPNTTGIPILMYHFFYDSSQGQTGADSNFTDVVEFEKQVKYLADNGYYTPTWSELADYIDGTKVLPEKSVILTFDDGASSFFSLAYPVLVKYQIHATSFIVTSWTTNPDSLGVNRNLISFQSHSNDMHQGGCEGGHGGLFQCIDHQLGLDDLNASKQVTGSSDAFCYPFGDYNDSEKQLLREAGFKVAVTTEYGKAQIGMDKLQLPRIRMNGGTSLEGFIESIN